MLIELVILAALAYYVVHLHRQNKEEGGPGVPIVGGFIDSLAEQAKPSTPPAVFELSCSTANDGTTGLISVQMVDNNKSTSKNHRRHHSRHRSKPSSSKTSSTSFKLSSSSK